MFTLHHRHTVSLDPKLSAQFDRLLDLWKCAAETGMTPEEAAAFTRLNNQEAEALENASRAAEK